MHMWEISWSPILNEELQAIKSAEGGKVSIPKDEPRIGYQI